MVNLTTILSKSFKKSIMSFEEEVDYSYSDCDCEPSVVTSKSAMRERTPSQKVLSFEINHILFSQFNVFAILSHHRLRWKG